jgi:hypothetical protein
MVGGRNRGSKPVSPGVPQKKSAIKRRTTIGKTIKSRIKIKIRKINYGKAAK